MDDRRERGIRLLDAITVCINEHPIVGQWIVEILDRKTELSDSDEPQTRLCRECEDYAGDGMFCAKNYMVFDFSKSIDKCEAEPQIERPCNDCQEFDCYGCEYKQMEGSE